MKSAVLFLIFKRPDTTRRVFERIREAQPPRLYIAADGPRKDRPDEAEKCALARQIVENVDWPCEIHRLYRDENLGCGKGVSSAITWFFDHEEQGIIIEDDILPHIDFFRYCDEMLEKYKDDKHIHLISGYNFFYDGYCSEVSYYLSDFGSIWGWASWKRVWKTYRYDVNDYPEKDLVLKIYSRFPGKTAKYYHRVYKLMKYHKIDTWDLQFAMNRFYFDRYSIVPFVNMVENIGFGSSDATHTNTNSSFVNRTAESPYPLRHPSPVMEDLEADRVAIQNGGMYVYPFGIRILQRITRKLKRVYESFSQMLKE